MIPPSRPVFEHADTFVAAAICPHGYDGHPDTKERSPWSPIAHDGTGVPPFFVAHGDHDTLLPVEPPVGHAVAGGIRSVGWARSGLAEGERVGLGAGVEERDLEGAVGDGAGLADELVQPLLPAGAWRAITSETSEPTRRPAPRNAGGRGAQWNCGRAFGVVSALRQS